MKKQKIYQLTTCALMTALMCILGPMSIPMGPIPISFTNFVIFLSVYLLGVKGATISYLAYLLLGAIGLPVFSGYQGGLAKLAGPTGGYLVGFILTIFISGVVLERTHARAAATILGMMASMMAAYLFGTVWFVLQMQCEVWYALTICVFPFLLVDVAKILVAAVLGKMIRRALTKADLLPGSSLQASHARFKTDS